MGADVAPGKDNPLKPIILGLCVLEIGAQVEEPKKRFPWQPDGEQEPEKPTHGQEFEADPYLLRLVCRPLQFAHVALRRTGAPHDEETIVCKTDAKGRLMAADVPEAEEWHPIILTEGETYDVFWTYDSSLFKTWSRLGRKGNALTDAAFCRLRVARIDAPQYDARKHRLPEWDKLKRAILLHNVGHDGAGYFDRADIMRANGSAASKDGTVRKLDEGDRGEFDGDEDIHAWAFARAPAIAAIHLAEYVRSFAQRERALSAFDYDQMDNVAALIEAAKNGRRVKELDEPLFGRLPTKGKPGINGGFHSLEYYEYARACGLAKRADGVPMDPDLFDRSLYDGGNILDYQGHWREAAEQIRAEYGIVHPSLDLKHPSHDWDGTAYEGHGADEAGFKGYNREATIAYFDFYQFGVAASDPKSVHNHHGWQDYVVSAKTSTNQAVQYLYELARRAITRDAPCLKTWSEFGWHVTAPADRSVSVTDAKLAMQRRYLEACEDMDLSWWDSMPQGRKAQKGDEQSDPVVEHEPEEVSVLSQPMKLGLGSMTAQADILTAFFQVRSRSVARRVMASTEHLKQTLASIKNVDRWIFLNGEKELFAEGGVSVETVFRGKQLKAGKLVPSEGLVVVKINKKLAGVYPVRVVEPEGTTKKAKLEIVEPEKAEGVAMEHAKGEVERAEKRLEQAKHAAQQAQARLGQTAIGHDRVGVPPEGATEAATKAQADVARAEKELKTAEAAKERLEVLEKGAEAAEAKEWGEIPDEFQKLTDEPKLTVPKWFAATAYALLAGFSVYELVTRWNAEGEDRFKLAFEAGNGVAFAIGSLAEASEHTLVKIAGKNLEHAMARAADARKMKELLPKWDLANRGLVDDAVVELEASENGAAKLLGWAEGFGRFGRLVGTIAGVGEMVFVAREGFLLAFGDDEEKEMLRETGHAAKARSMQVEGLVVLAADAAAIALAFGPGLVVAGAALAIFGIGRAIFDWRFGERKSAMDDIERRLVEGIVRELGKRYAPEHHSAKKYVSCRTTERILELVGEIRALEGPTAKAAH